MNFLQAVTSGFQNYANFAERSVRSEYWYWVLFSIIAGWGLGILDIILFGMPTPEEPRIQFLNLLFTLGTLVPGCAVTVRRLHDVDRSGWWMLILLTIVGSIPFIYWMCVKGTGGSNRFGPEQAT